MGTLYTLKYNISLKTNSVQRSFHQGQRYYGSQYHNSDETL